MTANMQFVYVAACDAIDCPETISGHPGYGDADVDDLAREAGWVVQVFEHRDMSVSRRFCPRHAGQATT